MGTTDLVTIGFQPMGNKAQMIQSAVGTIEILQPYPEDYIYTCLLISLQFFAAT